MSGLSRNPDNWGPTVPVHVCTEVCQPLKYLIEQMWNNFNLHDKVSTGKDLKCFIRCFSMTFQQKECRIVSHPPQAIHQWQHPIPQVSSTMPVWAWALHELLQVLRTWPPQPMCSADLLD